MLRQRNWLDRLLISISRTIDDWIALMQTREFWSVAAVGATVVGFLIAAMSMLINFDLMRMRNCFDASNFNAYLMFHILLFFVFDGMLAIGEIFNYFDDRRRGIPHKIGTLFWLIIITTALGSAGLIMVRVSC